MAKLFYKRVISGQMNISDVPQPWRNAVEEMLRNTPNN